MTSIIPPAELERISGFIADAVAKKLASQPLLVDRHRLSELIGLSVPTIDRRVRAAQIPVIRTGNRVLFDPGAVVAALERGSQGISIRQASAGDGDEK